MKLQLTQAIVGEDAGSSPKTGRSTVTNNFQLQPPAYHNFKPGRRHRDRRVPLVSLPCEPLSPSVASWLQATELAERERSSTRPVAAAWTIRPRGNAREQALHIISAHSKHAVHSRYVSLLHDYPSQQP